MVKYGKEFRKNQIDDWKEKYFCYKAQKQLIKKYMKTKEELTAEVIDNQLEKWSLEFEEGLDKDIKKVYIFFANKEKTLYKKINEYLHFKDDIPNFELGDFLNQYKQLKELSELSLNMSNFIFYNLKALIKILKKFDKKVITPQHKDLLIRINYIQTKIEEQNSDILYLLKFKMIDEVNVILEDLINTLLKEFKANKDRLGEEQNNDNENKLIEEVPPMNEATTIIRRTHEQIKKNIKEIDKVSARVTQLFMPWKDFLRISSDVNSKFLQIQRESNPNESVSSINLRSPSIINSIGFSKESKFNIFIVLLHGFLYMFCFSVIIPTYTSLFTNDKNKGLNWGFLMMMAPLGTLFNYLYETFLFKRSTKKPIIISCFGLIIGNVLYIISPVTHSSLLFIGRFICGLFNLRTHNKMYIINFLLQKDVSYYLTMFHTTSTLGLGVGFIINSGLLFIDSSNKVFNKSTVGPIITIFLSLLLLVGTIIKFTEAHSKQFNMTSMQMFGDGILSDEESVRELNSEGSDISKDVRRQTLILKDIDSKLGDFNQQSNFDDTNLVAKSVNELASKEEGGLHSLLNVFIVYLIVIFTTKFINESIFINSQIFMNQIIGPEKTDSKFWLIPVILGCSCFMILLVELSLSRKNTFISERNLVIILLFLLLINNILFILFHVYKLNHYFTIATDTILASITEKYVAHLFLYIIPDNYTLCRIHGNVLISIFSMFSRILCSGLLIVLNVRNVEDFNIIIYIFMTSLSFISFLLYLIFYNEIRVKAINRIIKSIPKDDIKIATEV